MFSDDLKKLRENSLLRQINDRNQLSLTPSQLKKGSQINIDGREYINFASNDYLGLAGNTSIADSVKKALDKYGFGSGASRLLSGGTEIHAELEHSIAEFKNTEAALIFNSGYTANISAIPSIAREGDVILSDEFNHASLVDGCRLSKAKKLIYRHRDAKHLSEMLENENGSRKIVITDSVFSMDGDIAPIPEIFDICMRHNALLYLDDAHGTGVLGDGKGALSHFGIKPEPWIIQMGTFSKAFGSYGAFIAADRDVIDWLINTARGFIYSTALPACIIAASLSALQLIQKETELIKRLWDNRERLFRGIHALGFDTLNSETPIIPLIPPCPPLEKGGEGGFGNVEASVKFSERLMNSGIYAPAIRPPTVGLPRIRFTVTAAHTEKDIDALLGALAEAHRIC